MQDVTSLVIQTLKGKKPNIPIYREKVPTAFQEPSFFVKRRPMTAVDEPNGYTMRSYGFAITYFPDPERPNEDMDQMAEWLAANMEIIEPNFAHAINREIEPQEDGTLVYTLSVPARVREAFEPRFDTGVEINGGIKNG